MITLERIDNVVKFTFSDNTHYLQDGTIEVPVNSLALITDDSEMFTFKKSASNDIFVSATYAEIGMTKAELITFYKDNMVGATGGGSSSGVTSGEVQTMIDTSISGKADSSAVTEEINAAVSGKADSSAVTEEINAAVSGKADSSAVTQSISTATADMATKTWVGQQGYLTEHQSLSAYSTTQEVDNMIQTSISGKADTSALTTYFGAVAYDTSSKHINFYNTSTGGTVLAYVDATNFIKDGMVDNVEIKDVTLSGQSVTCLVVTFNTDSGKEDINIPISEIFNANNYYTKTEVDAEISAATSGKADTSAVTQSINAAVSGKADTSAVTNSISAATAEIDARLSEDEEVTAAGLNALNDALSGKADTSAVTSVNNTLTAHTANTTVHVTSTDKERWDGAVTALDGMKLVKITQSAYEQLSTYDSSTLYIVTNS